MWARVGLGMVPEPVFGKVNVFTGVQYMGAYGIIFSLVQKYHPLGQRGTAPREVKNGGRPCGQPPPEIPISQPARGTGIS